MKKSTLICLLLLSLCLVFGLIACTEGNSGDTDTQGDTVVVTDGETAAQDTSADPAETTENPADTDPNAPADTATGTTADTEGVTEAATEPPPYVVDFNAVSAEELKSFFSSANQTDVSVATDDDGEQYVVLSTNIDNATDPFVAFNIANFIKKAELKTMRDVKKYDYLLLKVRQVGCSSGSFDLYYWTGNVGGATGGMNIMEGYDVSDDGWQYILFDMTDANGWSGKPNGFRFDYMMSAVSAGETIHIAEIQFLESAESYYKSFDVDWNVGFDISDEAKAEAESLLATVTPPKTTYDNYKGETATDEDASLQLWFDHMYTRAPQTGFTPTDKITYQIQLAKNETEGCQFVLAPNADVTGLKVYVTDFKNADGDTLQTELRWGYYFDVDGQYIIDPLPLVTYEPNQTMVDWCNGGNAAGEVIPNFQKYDGFDIKGGESQSFVLKATTTATTKAGEYSATVTVMSADGKQVKKATVFVYVWNFTLDDAASCKTLMDLGAYDIYVSYYDWTGEGVKNEKGQNLYEAYYNFMLEYRVNCYTLPTEQSNGNYANSENYLNNPRVQAFLALGWKTAGKLMSEDPSGNKFAQAVDNANQSLSQNQEWKDKAYFYPVDEPGNNGALDDINNYGAILQAHFPDYKLIAPMHVNYATAEGDYFSYVTSSVNVWCPKTFFFNTFAEWFNDRTLEYGTTPKLEEKLGSLKDRFYAEKEGGDEVWWYVTRYPNNPEITLIINTDAVNIRTLFWQQKLYDVDGFLYYSINHWNNTEGRYWVNPGEDVPYYNGLNQMHEINSAYPYEVYGSGILIYTGAYFAQTDPVPSLRLESIRDGIEDFEYLTMLEEIYGDEVVDAVIAQWTTSLGEYSTDVEAFRGLRAKLGGLLEAALANK